MNILITGSAGFIGYHLSKKLLKNNHKIYGLDNLNSYYDVKLKKNRINDLKKFKNFSFYKIDICKSNKIDKIIKKNKKPPYLATVTYGGEEGSNRHLPH